MRPPPLTDAVILLDALIAEVVNPEHGAIATFLGTTRREAATHECLALEYAVYVALAEAEIDAIAHEAEARFVASVCIQHRTGVVRVGETSVAIAVSAPHRRAAFAACSYAIDGLKARVPIWKRAYFADGTTTWFDETDTAVPAIDAPGT